MAGAGNVSTLYIIVHQQGTECTQNCVLHSTLMFVRTQTQFTTKRNTELAPSFHLSLIFVHKHRVDSESKPRRLQLGRSGSLRHYPSII